MGGGRLITGLTSEAAMDEDIRVGPATMVFCGVSDECLPKPLVMLLPMLPNLDVILETLDTTLFASKVSETESIPV